MVLELSKTIYWADLAAYGSNTIDVTSSLSDYASNMAFQTIQIQANKKDSVAPLISSFQAGYSAYSLDSGTNMPDEYQIQLTAEYSDNLNSIASVEIDGGFAFTNSEKTIMRKTISNDLYPWGDTFETYTLTVTDTDGTRLLKASQFASTNTTRLTLLSLIRSFHLTQLLCLLVTQLTQ